MPIVGEISDLLNTDKPDERQIMTYVSCFYHAFQGAMQVIKNKCAMWFSLEMGNNPSLPIHTHFEKQ